MPRWPLIALAASIVVNLFLLALIGGHLLHSQQSDASAGGTPLARALARAEASLPPRDAAVFDAVIRRNGPHYSAAVQQLNEARQEFERQMTAEPFNQEGMGEALATWHMAWDRFLDDFRSTLLEALAQISPEGRRKLIADRSASGHRPYPR
jgi:uncharacterized membrane protein